jgi:hypothetical protein
MMIRSASARRRTVPNRSMNPGFSQMEVYTCRECGELIRLADGPDIDQIFGPADDE